MTREEAIDLLDNLIGMIEDSQGKDYDKAIRLAIRSLEAWDKVFHEANKRYISFVPKNLKKAKLTKELLVMAWLMSWIL